MNATISCFLYISQKMPRTAKNPFGKKYVSNAVSIVIKKRLVQKNPYNNNFKLYNAKEIKIKYISIDFIIKKSAYI